MAAAAAPTGTMAAVGRVGNLTLAGLRDMYSNTPSQRVLVVSPLLLHFDRLQMRSVRSCPIPGFLPIVPSARGAVGEVIAARIFFISITS